MINIKNMDPLYSINEITPIRAGDGYGSHVPGDAAAIAPMASGNTHGADAPLLLATDPKAEGFKAVGLLGTTAGELSFGTGAVIAGSLPPDPNSQALVLTAAHVALGDGFEQARWPKQWPIGEVLNKPTQGQFIPAYFKDTESSHVTFDLDRIVYADRSNDTAIVSLNATYGDLQKLGIKPLQFGFKKNHPGMKVEVAHVPAEDIPEDERFMRYSTGNTFDSIETTGNGLAVPNLVPTNFQGARKGSSGAPIIADGKVIGVMVADEDPPIDGVTSYYSSIKKFYDVLNNGTPVFSKLVSNTSELALPYNETTKYSKGDNVVVAQKVYQLIGNSSLGEDPSVSQQWWYNGKVENFQGAVIY